MIQLLSYNYNIDYLGGYRPVLSEKLQRIKLQSIYIISLLLKDNTYHIKQYSNDIYIE